jgi:hypothetical protein
LNVTPPKNVLSFLTNKLDEEAKPEQTKYDGHTREVVDSHGGARTSIRTSIVA